MCCALIDNVEVKIKCKIVDKVLEVLNLFQSIFVVLTIKRLVTLTIDRINRHVLYLFWYAAKKIDTKSRFTNTWYAILRMLSCTKAVPEIK